MTADCHFEEPSASRWQRWLQKLPLFGRQGELYQHDILTSCHCILGDSTTLPCSLVPFSSSMVSCSKNGKTGKNGKKQWEERQEWHECFHALAYHEVASLPVFGVILLVTFALLLDGISLIILLLGLGGLLVFELMRNPVNMLGASFTIVSGIWGQQATELHCQWCIEDAQQQLRQRIWAFWSSNNNSSSSRSSGDDKIDARHRAGQRLAQLIATSSSCDSVACQYAAHSSANVLHVLLIPGSASCDSGADDLHRQRKASVWDASMVACLMIWNASVASDSVHGLQQPLQLCFKTLTDIMYIHTYNTLRHTYIWVWLDCLLLCAA